MDNIIPVELYLCEGFKYLNYNDIISFILTCKYYHYSLNDSWNIIFKNKYMEFYMKLCLNYKINSKKIISELDRNANDNEIEETDKYYDLIYNIKKYNTEISRTLISNNIVDIEKHGNWAFIQACNYGNITIVKLLLEYINPENNYTNFLNNGNLGFYYACKNGNMELVKLLMKDKRININGDVKNPLMVAIETINVQLVELLLSDDRLNPSVHGNIFIKIAKARKYITIYMLFKINYLIELDL